MPKKTVFLMGEKVILSPLDPKIDLPGYESWINNQDTTRYMAAGKYPLTQKGIREYIQHFKGSKDLLLGIFTKEKDQHIGNIALRTIDDRNRNADIGLMIGEPASRGRGLGSEALQLIVEHAFFSLNLHRVMAGIVEKNVASTRLFEKLGFKQEGKLREHFYTDGRYEDFLMYGLLRAEYPSQKRD
ncbi:MAG: GNAT family N-acetyltransferase [Candidatus Omnitrophica bacterium]|nr:GNAT family N-acetyltransferase [Candidatus Omnitrophota bacterium]